MNQKRRWRKSLRGMAAALALMVMLTSSALAATVTAKTDVNIRKEANQNSPVVTVMNQGTSTKSLGTSGNWIKVKVNGKTGYGYKTFFTVKKSNVSYVYTTARVNVRDNANKAGAVLTTLNKGTKVQKLGVVGNWTKVKVNGKTGYIMSKYVTSKKPAEKKAYVYATHLVNVRDTANKAGGVIAVLKEGTKVEKLGVVGNWTKVKVNGKTGYIMTKYVSSKKPAAKTYVYTTARVNVRDTANKAGGVITVLKKDSKVEKLGTVGNWTKVKVNGKTGYIMTKYVSSKK